MNTVVVECIIRPSCLVNGDREVIWMEIQVARKIGVVVSLIFCDVCYL